MIEPSQAFLSDIFQQWPREGRKRLKSDFKHNVPV